MAVGQPVDPAVVAALDAWIAERTDDLVDLTRRLVALDTTSVDLAPGSEHRTNREGELQAIVAEELAAIGGDVDQWEPDHRALARHPMMPPWHHWQGRPITVATYSVLIWSPERSLTPEQAADPLARYPHLALLDRSEWGLVVYDEVHLLPAPVFRMTSRIQAVRRLGLTATLVREDGREEDVFSLIGPKKYDVPWKDLEKQGWIAEADCIEVRIPLPDDLRMEYALAETRHKYRIAACNPAKFEALDELMQKHPTAQTLIIGMYLDQLDAVQQRYGFPIITGDTPDRERRKLYAQFRSGELQRLIISKVGNFAIDLPDASVMVQISGTFGSRQEEAQRLGRILRPKADGQLAHFYTLVTKDSQDQEFGANRQLFLTEQGYQYWIVYADEVADFQPRVAAAV